MLKRESLLVLIILIATGFSFDFPPLMIEIDNFPFEENIIIQTSTNTYIQINSKTQKIQITCSKLFTDRRGIIDVYVNNQRARDLRCGSVPFDAPFEDVNCLAKKFEFDLTNLNTKEDFFTVECSIRENPNVKISTKLYKLYQNPLPYIRSGSNIYPISEVSIHNIDLETVTCEVVFNVQDSSQPDEIQWFDMSKNSFQLSSNRKLLTANLVNVTNTFQLTEFNKNLFKSPSIYHCCTVVDNLPVLCAKSYLANNESLSIIETTTVTSIFTKDHQTSTIAIETSTDNLETTKHIQNTNVTRITTNAITDASTQTKMTTLTTLTTNPIEYLGIETDDFDSQEKVILKTLKETYVSMLTKTRRIKITCRKLSFREGSLIVSLNGISSIASKCNSFSFGSPIEDYFCLSKTFDYDLTNIPEIPGDCFNIICSIAQNEAFVAKAKLNKLYFDSLPRIRSGSNLFASNSVSVHDIDLEAISCEAVVNTDDKSQPDGIQWFNKLNKSFEFNFEKTIILSSIMNISSTFRLTIDNQNIFNPSSVHQCCTTLQKKIISCSSALIVSTIITETSSAVPIETTKNSFTLTTINNSISVNISNQTPATTLAFQSTPTPVSSTPSSLTTTSISATQSIPTTTTSNQSTFLSSTATQSISIPTTTTTVKITTNTNKPIIDIIQGKSSSINSNLKFLIILLILSIFT